MILIVRMERPPESLEIRSKARPASLQISSAGGLIYNEGVYQRTGRLAGENVVRLRK
jgi:hypothetical protein